MLRRRSRSPGETRGLAARLGRWLKPGDVLALTGELGSGKTEFVHGLARGLEVPSQVPVASPSFSLAHEYPGRCLLVHLDLYRLEALPPELLGELEEYLASPAVVAVEWAERLQPLLPQDYLEVRLTMASETERELTFVAHGPRSRALVAKLAGELRKKSRNL